MGKPSTTNPSHHLFNPLWIAVLLVLHPYLLSAQTAISAATVPLLLPSAIVYDPQGNLYIAETGNHVIRKIDAQGHITTIAGTGMQGFSGDNGLASAAQMDSPQGLAIDVAGNLYIADTHNHRIRRIDATTQIIATIAGNGTPGFAGDSNPATAAQLNLPTALALDTAGNLYFADSANHRIRRIDALSQIITTIVGNGTQGFSGDNGPATAASIDSPTGLALDAGNNLYLADTHNHRIRRIDALTQTITTIAGDGNLSTLALPKGISIDSVGNIYIADSANQRIRRMDAATGQIDTIAGNGTQGFTGDGGPAPAASLDSPRATTLSPANLVTIADTGNQRIRQIDTQSNLNPIAGLGPTAPNALTLTAASTITYGTGSILAQLTSSAPATGTITFLDSISNNATTLAAIPLIANAATLSTATLPAGQHSITATYTGDPTHLAAQSTILALTINPRPVQATLSPLTIFYGQPVPTLSGSVTGLLPQDATTVAVTFTTSATNFSPTGIYSITASLTGAAAGNYALTANSTALTISPAATLTTLSATTPDTTSGTPITLTTHVASTTTGSPTGSLTIYDSTTPLTTAAVNPSGNLNFTIGTLIAGSHSLTAVYSGDTNFTASTSAPAFVSITATTTGTADFSLTPTTATTQNAISGGSAIFSFTTQTQGVLNSPITLAAAGLPTGATASFNPAYLPPGTSSSNFTLTINTPATKSQSQTTSLTIALLFLPITLLASRRRSPLLQTRLLTAALLTIVATLVSACGDRVNTGAQSAASLTSYPITITATATSPTGAALTHTAVVTLILQATQ